MTARDELIHELTRSEHAPMSDHDPRDGSCRSCPWPLHELSPDDIADALIAEGWRKMPSRKAVEQALANSWDDATEYEGAVDAILALMDGSNDE